MTKLSIVILSFNTKKLLGDCLKSLKRAKSEIHFEVIVVDNGSKDRSVEFVKKNYKWVRTVEVGENLGFSRGNNLARRIVKGEYVLFLNSDTKVNPGTLKETVEYMDEHPEVGALTCRTILPSGEIDKDAMRSFPTPWVAFTHFSYLDRLFPASKLFSRYWYGYLDVNEIQEIESLQGAFFLTSKRILDKVDWFDEDYFLDGEDIDLSWKIKRLTGKIIYYPNVSIIHVKKASKKGKRSLAAIMAGVSSMEIFYNKRLARNYSIVINALVYIGIKFLKVTRYINYLTQ